MIERIILRNFQAHTKLDLVLDRVTCIVGRTDAGKSAILRALRWVMLNRPSGDGFIHHDKDSCQVSIIVEDNVLSKSKGSKNLYTLNEKEFTAFGTNVPEEITNLLNVSELNFQQQMDSPFWLMESPGIVAKELNAIVDLSSIDRILENVATEHRKVKTELEIVQLRLTDAQAAESKLEWIENLAARFDRLKARYTTLCNKRSQIDLLTKIVNSANKTEIVRSDAIFAKKIGQECLQHGSNVQSLQNRCTRLQNLINEIRWTDWQASQQLPDITPLSNVANNIQMQQEQIKSLRSHLLNITEMENKLCRLQKEKIAQEKILEKETKGKACPMCGNPNPILC